MESWVQDATEILWKRGGPGMLPLAACPTISPGAGREMGREGALPAFAAGLAELSSTCF